MTILAGFVLVSSGVILYLYSAVLTAIRQGLPTTIVLGYGVQPFSTAAGYTNAMFAGMLLEVIFLVSCHCTKDYVTRPAAAPHLLSIITSISELFSLAP